MVTVSSEQTHGGKRAGTQTLARGPRALGLAAGAPEGRTFRDVAGAPGVHRIFGDRPLAGLEHRCLVVRARDGRLRAGAGRIDADLDWGDPCPAA